MENELLPVHGDGVNPEWLPDRRRRGQSWAISLAASMGGGMVVGFLGWVALRLALPLAGGAFGIGRVTIHRGPGTDPEWILPTLRRHWFSLFGETLLPWTIVVLLVGAFLGLLMHVVVRGTGADDEER